MESENNYSLAGIRHFVSDNWASMSEPLCSMLSFVCTVNLWYVHITASMTSSPSQLHCDCFGQPVCLLSSPISTPLHKYVQQWDHTWAMPTEEAGKEGPLRFGTKKPPGALLQFATYALLPHSCLLHYLLYLCSGHFLVLSRGVVKSRVLSRGAVKRCCQGVVSSGVVKWYCQGVVSSGRLA